MYFGNIINNDQKFFNRLKKDLKRIKKKRMDIFMHLNSKIRSSMYKIHVISSPNYLTKILSHPNILIKYLKSEYYSTFCMNVFVSVSGLLIAPLKFKSFYECSPFLTFWMLTIGALNFLILLPKFFALMKLQEIDIEHNKTNENQNNADFYKYNNELKIKLWFFIRCTAFLNTQKMAKLIFFVTVLGSLEVWHVKFDISYLNQLSTLIILVTFTRMFRNWKKLEKILENFNKNKKIEQINSIPIKIMGNDSQTTCSICFEEFRKAEAFQELPCAGKHIFHTNCISNWFQKKLSCPNCNSALFPNT